MHLYFAVEGDLAFGCWRCDACDKEIPFASADRMAGQLHELLEDEMKGGVDQLQQFLAMTSPILGPQHYITLIGKPLSTLLFITKSLNHVHLFMLRLFLNFLDY